MRDAWTDLDIGQTGRLDRIMQQKLTSTLALPYSVHPPSTVVHPSSPLVNLYGNAVMGTSTGYDVVLTDVAAVVSARL